MHIPIDMHVVHVYNAYMTSLNTLILVLALIPLCLGAASFLSPRTLRACAAWLLAWAEGVEAFTSARRSGGEYWRSRLVPPTADSVADRLELGVR